MDIDSIQSKYEAMDAAVQAALERCRKEQEAGRTGFTAWKEADELNKELAAFVSEACGELDEALKSLGRDN